MPKNFQVFFDAGADHINQARLQHLASLGLDLVGQRVLEVGGGVGRLTGFFEQLNCSILSTDGRLENVNQMRSQFPQRQTEVVDLETVQDLTYLGSFNVVFCYGTLYHLQHPEQAFRVLAPICRDLFLLETCVTPGDELAIHPIAEDPDNPNQAVSGTGCRPTRPWVMATLKQYFEFVYVTTYQPAHADFDLDWQAGIEKKLHRAVFVASRQPLELATLSTILPPQQTYHPESYATWIDVGAHQGQSTLGQALHNPALTVYAFEPNSTLAQELTGVAPNYVVIPAAVSHQDGTSPFYLNQEDAASSLLPFNEPARQAWAGGEQLQVTATTSVPTVRLDTFLQQRQIDQVHYLKIDAQGADLDVVRSLGDRLADCHRIQLEVAVTEEQLYTGAATRQEVMDYLTQRDFVLIRVQRQSHSQEENLTFVQRQYLSQTPDVADYLDTLQPDELSQLASAIAIAYPLALTPGWYFDVAFNTPEPGVRSRRKIWEYARSTQPCTIPFAWYSPLKLQLYLGNDLSRQLFISGTYDPNEFYGLSQVLSPGMTVLDVGANEGLYSLFAAQQVTTSGMVVAFEPSQREFDRLQTNLTLNQLAQVKPLQLALANVNTRQVLKVADGEHSGQNTLGDFAYEGVNCLQTETVELRRLDDLLPELGIQQVDVIKMDVEGAEFAVLQGAQATLQHYRPLLMLEFVDQALQNQGSSCAEVVQFLHDLGYKLLVLGPLTGVPVPTTGAAAHNTNAIAVHSERHWPTLSEAEQTANLIQELEQTQQRLARTEAKRQQTQVDFDRQVRALKKKMTDAAIVAAEELAATQVELDQNKQVKEEVQRALEATRNQIVAMESSKFWQFRDRWLNLKRKLGLPAEE
jgi:FkbM family methyltransferase